MKKLLLLWIVGMMCLFSRDVSAAEYTGYLPAIPHNYNSVNYGDAFAFYAVRIDTTRVYRFNPVSSSGTCPGKLYVSGSSIFYGGKTNYHYQEFKASGGTWVNSTATNATLVSANYNSNGQLSTIYDWQKYHTSLPVYANDCTTILKQPEWDSINSPPPRQLSIAINPAESGNVTGNAGIACGTNYSGPCPYTIPNGTQLSLQANPNPGQAFDHWDDGLSHTNNPWIFTMSANKNVTAVFTPIIYNISVNPDTAKGSVVSSEENPFIRCDDQANSLCDNNYTWHESIILTANPKPGYAFVRWEENNITVSTDRAYCFLVQWSRNLVPVFEEFRLGFPLEDRVPYKTEGQTAVTVTSVMDHSLSGGYYTSDGRNSKIEAFNGLIAEGAANEHSYAGNVYCYDVATETSPFPELDYFYFFPPNESTSGRTELCYDEHPGYNFSGLSQTYDPNQTNPDDGQPGNGHNILATEAGKLYKDTTGMIYSAGWNSLHAFYIDHNSNGNYSWYLHCGRLLASIESQIQSQGYAVVTKGQHIAEVSGYGLDGQNTYPDHLHFEVRLNGIDHANVIDPYGENLWDQPAP